MRREDRKSERDRERPAHTKQFMNYVFLEIEFKTDFLQIGIRLFNVFHVQHFAFYQKIYTHKRTHTHSHARETYTILDTTNLDRYYCCFGQFRRDCS